MAKNLFGNNYSILSVSALRSRVFPWLNSDCNWYVVRNLAIICNRHSTTIVASMMTKCEIEVPISSQDPVFLTKNKKFRHIMSQHSKIIMKKLSSGI